nr:hypothetical protein JDDFFMMN_00097 [Klebsiella pneumoniae]
MRESEEITRSLPSEIAVYLRQTAQGIPWRAHSPYMLNIGAMGTLLRNHTGQQVGTRSEEGPCHLL